MVLGRITSVSSFSLLFIWSNGQYYFKIFTITSCYLLHCHWSWELRKIQPKLFCYFSRFLPRSFWSQMGRWRLSGFGTISCLPSLQNMVAMLRGNFLFFYDDILPSLHRETELIIKLFQKSEMHLTTKSKSEKLS